MTPNLYDLNSAEGVRQIVAARRQGYNYRLYTEGQTRNQLLEAYDRLHAIRRRLPDGADHGEWMSAVRAELDTSGSDLALTSLPERADDRQVCRSMLVSAGAVSR